MDEAEALLSQGKQLLQEGNLQESKRTFSQVITSGHEVAEGYYGLGIANLRLGDLQAAISCFESALQRSPRNVNALYWLGVIAENQQREGEAHSFYGRVLDINPQHKGAQEALQKLSPDFSASTQPSQNNSISSTRSPFMRSRYDIYEYLQRETNPLFREALAAIDALRMKVRPSLTANLGWYLRIWIKPCVAWVIVAIAFTIARATIPGFFRIPVVGHIPPFFSRVTYRPSMLFWVIAIGIIALAVVYGVYFTYTYIIVLERGRLQLKQGVFNSRLNNIELLRVESIILEKTLLQRLTGDGTLVLQVHTSALNATARTVRVPGLAKGEHLDEIYQQLLALVSLLRSLPFEKGIIS